jgi:hypothetical protein
MAMPVFAQYAGPAILSRGEAPSAMTGAVLDFLPFVDVSGVYSTGLSGVLLNAQGNVANAASAGVQIAGGISGSHRWRHTSIGLSYRGDYTRYFRESQYNGVNQSMLFNITHQINRHIMFSSSTAFGIINRDYGLLSSLSPSVPFDPSQNYVPTTDFFDNRTIYVNSSFNLVYQKSTRLSFAFGGGLATTIRSSSALYGVNGVFARGDMQYRLDKNMTIGASYGYTHYLFTGLESSTDAHTFNANFGWRMSRNWELSSYGGVARVETKFIQNVAVDPTIAAIIGITESSEVIYGVIYTPSLGVRLSRTFHKGVASVGVTHGFTPGNGLFLTSTATNVIASYNYTGMIKRWSIGTAVNHQDAVSIGNVIGTYGGTSVSGNLSRRMTGSLNIVGGASVFRYDSASFNKYNLFVYSVHLGLGWTPGDVPIRFW